MTGPGSSSRGPLVDSLRERRPATSFRHRDQAASAGHRLPEAMVGTDPAKCCQLGGKWGEQNANNRTGNSSRLSAEPSSENVDQNSVPQPLSIRH